MTETQNPNRLDFRQAHFHFSASKLSQCPEDNCLEVAFIGRSNAGKSSAINMLTGQKKLARTSKTPGRTQLLNYFALSDTQFLVDLPGFGYAKVPPRIKQQWQKELELYLQQRQSLQGLVLLMDIRHPFKDFDQMMIDWAEKAEMPVHILLTKADKLKRGPAQSALLQAQKHVAQYDGMVTVQLFSALKGDGVKELGRKLNEWLVLDEELSEE